MTYDPGSHTIEEVQAYLADHPDETAAVLAAEQARGDDARSTLVNSLQSREGREGEEGGETPDVPEDIDAGHPTGEYPTEGTFGYNADDVALGDAGGGETGS